MSYLRLVRKQYEVNDDGSDVQTEEDLREGGRRRGEGKVGDRHIFGGTLPRVRARDERAREKVR